MTKPITAKMAKIQNAHIGVPANMLTSILTASILTAHRKPLTNSTIPITNSRDVCRLLSFCFRSKALRSFVFLPIQAAKRRMSFPVMLNQTLCFSFERSR
jgi:hypothetical protein